MATISSSIRLQDNMTPVIGSMLKSMNMVISSFESMDRASQNAIDTRSLAAARTQLQNAGAAFQQIEKNIANASNEQNNFNKSISNGTSSANGLWTAIKGVAATAATYVGIKKLFDLSDTYSQTIARMNLMNDGLQTTDKLQDDVLSSANRARSEYQSMADMVGKVGIMGGSAFSSSEDIVRFSELLNKQFKIGGTSATEASYATQQLSQALASGVLRGDEFNSIMENAPTYAKALATYLDTDVGGLRAMAEQGQLTSDIMVQAMFATADQTDAAFSAIKPTFTDIWTVFKNNATEAWESVNRDLSDLANSPGVTQFFATIVSGIRNLTPSITNAVNGFIAFANNPDVQNLFAGLIQGISQLIGFLVDATTGAATFIGGFVGVDGIATAVGIIAAGFVAIKAASAGIAGFSALSKLAETLGIISASSAGGGTAISGLGALFAGISAPVVGVVAAIGALIAILAAAWASSETFRNSVGTAFSTLGQSCSDAVARIQSAFAPVIGSLSGFGATAMPIFEQIGNILGSYVVPAITYFLDKFIYVISSIIAALAPMLSALGNVFSFIGNVIGAVCAILNGDWATAWQMAQNALYNAGMFFYNVLNAAINLVLSLLSMMCMSIGDVFNAIWGIVTNIGQNIINSAVSAFWGMIDGIVGVLANLLGVTVDGFNATVVYMMSLPGQFLQWGQDMIQSMIDGVNNMIGGAVGAVTGLVDEVIRVFKEGFGIHSPSTVMYDIGSFLMSGLINSLNDSDIASFCASMVEDIKAAFSGGNFNLASALSWLGTGAEDILKAIGITIPQLNSLVGGFIWPTNSTEITSGFGSRVDPITGEAGDWHEGIDIGAAYGDAVAAAAAGVVELAGWNGGYGNCVMIDHGNGLETLYGHLSEIEVAAGQMVSAGQEIGKVGSTGNSTGPHLHFGVRQNGEWIDPTTANFGGASSGGDLTSWINQAMSIVGVSGADNFNHLYQLAMAESGGDPNAINDWDSNAMAGTPSMGLMQTIQSTFDAYSLGGSIWDPVSNAVAAIRYMIDVYGSILNTPLTGYATGTNFATRGLHLVGEKGPELINFGGGEKVLTADKTSQILKSARSVKKDGNGVFAPVVKISMGDTIVNSELDIDMVAKKLGKKIKEEIIISASGLYDQTA